MSNDDISLAWLSMSITLRDKPSLTTVSALEKPNHEIIVLYKNQSIHFDIYIQQQKQTEVVPSKSIDFALSIASKAHKPAPDHPWRKFNLNKNATPKGDSLTLG
jgi:hypothetical protein